MKECNRNNTTKTNNLLVYNCLIMCDKGLRHQVDSFRKFQKSERKKTEFISKDINKSPMFQDN